MPRSQRVNPDPVEDEEGTEETTPRRRRRRDEDEDEETTPRRSRRVADEDDEDDDEPAPVKRKSRRARPEPEDVDEETGDEDSDEEAAVIPISRGREQIKKNRPVGEGGMAFFKWDEEPQLVKFLSNEPWAYDQHWVTRDGKQSFPCMGKGCPLCAIGVKVSQKVVYPILNLTPPKGEDPIVQTVEIGVTLEETLIAYDADKKTGPLDRLWWSMSRTEGARSRGSRKKYNYVFTPVKDRDLEEDWEIDLDEAEDAVDAAEIPDPDTVLGKWTRKALQEIADEAMGR